MRPLALIVEYEVHPGCEAEFEALMLTHARACLVEEPGCLRFEILRPVDDEGRPIPHRLLANELFRDSAALVAHRATARWQALAQRFPELLANRRPTTCEVQSNAGA